MHERYAVAFQAGSSAATGRLDVEHDRLILKGVAGPDLVELEIPFSQLTEVQVGRRPEERLNGYRTLMLKRTTGPVVRVAPLGLAMLPEIADLLQSLTRPSDESVLAVSVRLKPGCRDRARKLLAKGPPLDPASLGLSGHEVYLSEDEAVFVFHGCNVRARVSHAIRQPAVWRAGLAWQRCFAAPPQIIDQATLLNLNAEPAYRWVPPSHRSDS
jgi:hypothetical protein